MAHRKTSSMATTVNVDALRDRARALEALIIAEVGAFKVSGKLAIRRQEYLIRPDFNLWYSVDPTLMNFEMATTEEDDWHWKDLESFLESQILEHEVCSQVTQVLQDGGRDTHLVRAFASRIAYDAALKETPELEQHIATLLRDATDSPLEYRARLWLTGITLDEDVVDVSDSLSFRRPTREDLQERVRAEAVPYAHAGFLGRIHFSCIADCKVSGRRPVELQRHIDQLITALRLFRLGSVSAARYDYHAESFSAFASGSFGGHEGVPRLAYTLSTSDRQKLLAALQVLMPVLPSSYELPEIKPNFLSTALGWYAESLLARGPTEGTIAWAVACLEALFLGDNPSTELSFRLTQRVIALLRCFGWAPLDMQRALKKSYEVRSKHVHGAISRKRSHEELGDLYRSIAQYARVSCLIWAQLLTERKRSDVLATLEGALIDDTANIRLQQWCKKVDFAQKP